MHHGMVLRKMVNEMDIKKLAEDCGASKHSFPEGDRFIIREHELELFAQKIREERDKEWQAEPVAHMLPSDLLRFETSEIFAQAFSITVGNPDEVSVPLFTKPKEMK